MRGITIFLLAALGTFLIDQGIKAIFIEGYYRAGTCIDLELHYNKGVAFSLFAFLGPYLKWIQGLFIIGILVFMIKEGYIKRYAFPVGLVIGGAFGNLYDRFVHGGVVDYVAWHCGFDFAVFNYADVAIDLGIVWLLIAIFIDSRGAKEQ
jgi:signal peptidase II